MPKLSEMIFGKKPKMKQIPTMNPQQQQLLQMLLGGLGGGKGGQGGAFNQVLQLLQEQLEPGSEDVFAAPYQRQFEEQTIPGLAERFAGFGANSGALSSSGFAQSLGAAGAGLQERLASLGAENKRGSMKDIMSLLSVGLGQQPFQYHEKPGHSGIGSSLFGQLPYLLAGGF